MTCEVPCTRNETLGYHVTQCSPDKSSCYCDTLFYTTNTSQPCAVSIYQLGQGPAFTAVCIACAVAFFLLACLSAYYILVLKGVENGWRWGSRNKVHVVIVLWGLVRAIYLSVDPFSARGILYSFAGRVVNYLLFNMGYACGMTAFLVVVSFWIRVAKRIFKKDTFDRKASRAFLVYNILIWLVSVVGAVFLGMETTHPSLVTLVRLIYNLVYALLFLSILVAVAFAYRLLISKLTGSAQTREAKHRTLQKFARTSRMVKWVSLIIFFVIAYAIVLAFLGNLLRGSPTMMVVVAGTQRGLELVILYMLQRTLAPRSTSGSSDKSSGKGGGKDGGRGGRFGGGGRHATDTSDTGGNTTGNTTMSTMPNRTSITGGGTTGGGAQSAFYKSKSGGGTGTSQRSARASTADSGTGAATTELVATTLANARGGTSYRSPDSTPASSPSPGPPKTVKRRFSKDGPVEVGNPLLSNQPIAEEDNSDEREVSAGTQSVTGVHMSAE